MRTITGVEMTKEELERDIVRNAGVIAGLLMKSDVELRNGSKGVTVAEVRKKVIVKGNYKME